MALHKPLLSRPYGQASCCSRAVLLLLLVAAVASSLARPAAAASIISTACPTGDNIVDVPANTDLADAFYNPDNGAGKTYVLQRGRGYTLSRQIELSGDFVGVSTPSVTCFIGGGDNRGDVVITATNAIPANTPAFYWSSDNAAITFGIKRLTLNNGVNAAGLQCGGTKMGWSIQDVTVRGGIGGLYTDSVFKGELDDVAFEHIEGDGVERNPIGVYPLRPRTASYRWRDLVVVNCSNPNSYAVMSINPGAHVTIAGRVHMARNRGGTGSLGGALYVDEAHVDFTGHVTFEGNQGAAGGAAYITGSSAVRFAESSTLLVKGNLAQNGGGFYINSGSTVLMLGTTQFIGNTATGSAGTGGAVFAVSNSQLVFNAVCISQNTATYGSGIELINNAVATFNLPAVARMADNRPAASSIRVQGLASFWTCSGSERREGEYTIEGPICDCTNDNKNCPCPDTSPGACACGVCEPGSGPCCTDAAQLAPCTRSIQLTSYAQRSSDYSSSSKHSAKHSGSVVSVELVATVWDTASGLSAPAVNVPVSFAVHGDCAPDMAARSSITDAQGRAHARVTFSRPPGNVAVVAAVRSGGSLPSRVVTAVRHLKFMRDDAAGYGAPEADGKGRDDGEEPERTSYEHDASDVRTRRNGANHADADARAYEAVATQMVLQVLQEGEVSVSGGTQHV